MNTEDTFSFESDAYAFGIVLYELLSGILPYSDGGTGKNETTYESKQLAKEQVTFFYLKSTHVSIRIISPL